MSFSKHSHNEDDAEEPQSPALLEVMRTPSGSGGFFSRAYVAHCVADGVVVGIRAITPLAHVYCFHWLIYPLIRKQLKRTVLMPLFMKAASILPVDWVLWIVGKMTANLKSSAGSAGAKVAHISDVVERTSSATATRSMIPIYSLAIRLLKMMFKYWMVIEVLFFYFYLYRYYKLNRVVGPDRQLSAEERKANFQLCLDQAIRSGQTSDEFCASWFPGHNPADIKKMNLVEWLCAPMFSKKLADCSNVEVNEVMQLLDGLMSSDSGRVRLREAGEGYDPNVQPIEVSRFTYLPIQSFHRPFIFYGAISVAAQMGGVCLRRMGFQLCQGRHLNYWYYEGKPFIAPACTKDTNYPVVLSHGVGVGAFTYMYFISKIMAKYRGNKSIFLPECPFVSMKLAADHVPSAEEHAVSIKESLEKHGYSKAIFCGHSYGTFMGTFAVRFYPDIVERLVLIDPVCFLLHQPQGVINFIKGQKPTSALQSMMKYLAKTELGILHTLQRHVWWYNNSLWANLIPPNSSVVLSAHDDITPSHLVRDYLEKENELLSVDKKESRGNLRQKVNIVWFKNLGHAGFQMNGKAIEKILSSCFP